MYLQGLPALFRNGERLFGHIGLSKLRKLCVVYVVGIVFFSRHLHLLQKKLFQPWLRFQDSAPSNRNGTLRNSHNVCNDSKQNHGHSWRYTHNIGDNDWMTPSEIKLSNKHKKAIQKKIVRRLNNEKADSGLAYHKASCTNPPIFSHWDHRQTQQTNWHCSRCQSINSGQNKVCVQCSKANKRKDPTKLSI